MLEEKRYYLSLSRELAAYVIRVKAFKECQVRQFARDNYKGLWCGVYTIIPQRMSVIGALADATGYPM